MLHIHTYTAAPNVLHLVLEGDLDKVHVVALQDAIRNALPFDELQVVLHCDGLQSVDDEGVHVLAHLKHEGATLNNVPLLVDWKLRLLEQQPQSNT